MKRFLSVCTVVLTAGLLAGCSGSSSSSATPKASNTPKPEQKTSQGKGGIENPPPP